MRGSILVVENHSDLRSEIVALLTRADFECEGVSSGDAALLKLRDHDYQYIVLDADAQTDGTMLYDSCADNGTLAKIVLLTDLDETDERPSSKCAVLRKPFDTKDLLARVTRS